MFVRVFQGFVIAGFFSAITLWGQLTVSTLRGTATDQAGAVVVKAQITVVNLSTNLTRTIETNDSGDFEVVDLQLGTYRLTATHPGFKTFVADNIVLESSQVRRVNVAFELGAVGTEVTVRADAAVIATESGTIQTTFDKQRFEEAPLIGDARDPQTVLVSLPMLQNAGSLYSIEFAGQSGNQIQSGIDGHTNNGVGNQIDNVHDVQETVAVAVNNSAEFARVGYFDLTTKSGTNKFHLNLDYWDQNSALNARDFFATTKPVAKAHTMGAAASGPIRKDKTFFYGSWTGQRWPGGIFYTRNVPTNEMRAGDFSELLTGSKPTIVKDPLSGAPFPGNVIPTSRINPLSLQVQNQFLPAPDQGGPHDQARNFGFLFPYPGDVWEWDYMTERIDHKISDKNTIHGRVSMQWGRYIRYIDYPALIRSRYRPDAHVTVEDTHLFSPTLVNTFRVGWYKETLIDGTPINGFTPVHGDQVVKELGLQGVNPQNLSAMGFPTMAISGYSNIDIQPGGTTSDIRDWGFADAVTWARGKHVLKVGGEYKPQSSFSSLVPQGSYGLFTFNGSLSGFSYADFLLGLPYESQRLNPIVGRTQTDSELGIFAQDAFKVSSRLTLDLGVRWDRFGPAGFQDGLIYNWDPKTGDVIVPQSALKSITPLYPTNLITVAPGPAQESPSLRNFVPRIGVAYRPLGDKFVIRGGYGIYNESLGYFTLAQAGTSASSGGPYQLFQSYFNSIQNGQPAFQFPNPFPSGPAAIPALSISGYPQNSTNGKIHQFNVSIERQVMDIGLRISYVGARDRNMHYTVNVDQELPSLTPFSQSREPYPQFNSATYYRNNGSLNYNALTLEGQRKVGQIIFDTHFTWQSNYANYQNVESPYAPLVWSHDPYSSKLRAVVNAGWTVPVGKGRRFLTDAPRAVNFVLGGWQLYWIAIMETGQYFTATFSGSDPSNTNHFGGLPDLVGNPNLPSAQRSINHWFNAAAYAVPQPGHLGNSVPYGVVGPGLYTHNATLSKDFKFRERYNFTFMAAAQDLFNHPNFANPAGNISSAGTVGVVTSTKGFLSSRSIELRARLRF